MNADEKKWWKLQSKIQQTQIENVFKMFRSGGVEPILIKGFAIERLYPPTVARISTDIDLAVNPAQIDVAKRIVTKKTVNIHIDLHEGLRHLDERDWEKLFENSVLIKLNGTAVRVLSEEDHLRVLCVHWLTDGGENKRKLEDIYYAIDNRAADFDWERCFAGTEEKRRLWIIYCIGIAHKYLNLDISDLPFATEASNIPRWLPRTLERIWRRKYPFTPLFTAVHKPQVFIHQILYRLPPNPIMATIGVNGHLNAKTRIFYQIEHFLRRTIPSIKSLTRRTITNRDNE